MSAEVEVKPVDQSRVARTTLAREARAECRECGAYWAEAWALAHGATHARERRHTVEAHYSAHYLYARPGAS